MSQILTPTFRPQFTKIKGISDRRRLPRLGKIRLGVKVRSQKTGKEYPKETDYFVCPPEVMKVYGDRPKELDVMFPVNDIQTVFPQRLAWFGASRGVKCIGDGETAMRIEEPDGTRYDEMKTRDCPCELLDHGCSRRAHLLIIVPKVSVSGIYQIDVGSYNSIVDINSGLDYVQGLVGRFAMVPLKLKRVPRETHGSGRKEIHYTLGVYLEGDVNFINMLRESTTRVLAGVPPALPAPVTENPALDEGATIEIEAEEPNGNGKSEAQPPSPADPSTQNKPDEQPMTEEEVMQEMKERGMITDREAPEEKPPEKPQEKPPETPQEKPSDKKNNVNSGGKQKTDEVALSKSMKSEIYKFTVKKDLMTWYNFNKKEWKSVMSAALFADVTRLVNDQLGKLK